MRAHRLSTQAVADCRKGGQPTGGGARGYVPFGRTAADFVIGHFDTSNANPAVIRSTTRMRTLNPCGDLLSTAAAVRTNLRNLDEITVPVLVLAGQEDAFFPPPAVARQAGLFTGSRDVDRVVLPNTGHALTLHYGRDRFSAAVTTWLNSHGFRNG